MTDLHFTILIDGSPDTIFAVLADLERYNRWLPRSGTFGGIRDVAPLPVGLGTTYVDYGPSGKRMGKITEFEPPTCISFHQPMQVKQAFVECLIEIDLRLILEPEGNLTRLNRDLTLGIQGRLKIAQPLIIATFRRENQRVLRILKTYVEQGGFEEIR